MHMADALVTPTTAVTVGMVSAALIVAATRYVGKEKNEGLIPLMGVTGAFVFAVQMINFSIPGTGSSGHLIGGILLSALLGPWAGLLTLTCVLVIQCLFFADGGLLALGCNVFNMAVCACLIAHPLVFRPFVRQGVTAGRLVSASIFSCVAALVLGALCVTIETSASGITALPFREFLMFMLPIHFVIGVCEGIATAGILCFILKYRPELLTPSPIDVKVKRRTSTLWAFALLALVLCGISGWIASGAPDGLEWSILKVTGE